MNSDCVERSGGREREPGRHRHRKTRVPAIEKAAPGRRYWETGGAIRETRRKKAGTWRTACFAEGGTITPSLELRPTCISVTVFLDHVYFHMYEK